MKRLALVAAVFALAACSTKEETPAADTAAPAMTPAPAPAPTDTGMKMDTTMKRDTTDTTTKRP
jgi:hypothetical protein